MTADLTNPIFNNEEVALAHIEASRWPDGPFCPHCGSFNVHRMGGKTQAGMFICRDCRDKFTVRVGTVFERSHIPLHKWLLAMHLMAASKKGISAHQLWRMLGFGSYRTAWFMAHRIREAMRDDNPGPLGGEGKVVEADETYFGQRENPRTETTSGRPFIKKGKAAQKRPVVALVERGGHVRMFHVEDANAANVRDVLVRNVDRKSDLHTDESRIYTETGKEFAAHRTVKHSAGEYVRYEDGFAIHSNTVENVFSVFKRGMKGVYQHCGEAHLHRYIAEFDFRYNRRSALGWNDTDRAADALKGAEGKRLMYRQPH
jgi:transposase-like protein